MSPSAPSRTTSLSGPGPGPGPGSGRVNPLLPLSAHYDLLNRTVLPAFASAHAAGSFSVAYAVGAKFVEMALVSIPSHGYFGRDTGGGEGGGRTGSIIRTRTLPRAGGMPGTGISGTLGISGTEASLLLLPPWRCAGTGA